MLAFICMFVSNITLKRLLVDFDEILRMARQRYKEQLIEIAGVIRTLYKNAAFSGNGYMEIMICLSKDSRSLGAFLGIFLFVYFLFQVQNMMNGS